jgi:7,8-dihydropterin-6-yl-methyl-4-(beta-D-ribofuranosyl)aminobenzene 5'-phosphate synthase
MELTVLVDNSTLIDRYLLGEPGLAFHLRDGDRHILFDCGYSDVLIRNAARLDIDLRRLDTVVLSHGHLDHTGGLTALAAHFAGEAFEGRPRPHPRLLAHPEALAPKYEDGGTPIGSPLPAASLAGYFSLDLTREPAALTDRLVFLGEIPRILPFETPLPVGSRQTDAGPVPDTLPDDTALAYRGEAGLVIVTGCSHAGIGNILEHARNVTGERRLAAIIGGLHLLAAPWDRLAATVDFLGQAGPAALYPCHCTDLAAKMALAQAVPIFEVGVGLTVSLD